MTGMSQAREATSSKPLLLPLMSGRDRASFAVLSLLWLGALALFWTWWLRPEHNTDTLRFVINSILLFWTTVIPGYFILIFARSRIADPSLPLPVDWRVAMVVTKAPSEPAAVVQRTLGAMLAQRYPHDTWLADEDPTSEILAWCAERGVRVSTRKGVAAYHNTTWPRRTKCKEGNLAYFYDTYGYDTYDLVVQLDADHVPEDGYLEAMLRPFLDPAVGYVSAPSICDSNADGSWSARGRLYVEGALHGALQAGYNGGLAPLCIGSHYAVRTTALREVGGLGPELAEDHSTTLIMNSGGWRGVHALDALAHGEGPSTFPDLAVQEFQWSRSLMTILLDHTPRYIGALPLRLKLQFLFSQLWYPLFSFSMLAMVLIPIVALLTGRAWAGVVYVDFFFRMTLVTVTILLLMQWVRAKKWFRPDARVLSWEGTLFLFARWPWSVLGGSAAIFDWIRGRQSGFRVTPKGGDGAAPLPFTIIAPYLIISLASGGAAAIVQGAGSAAGFYVFSLLNCLLYLGVALAIIALHWREQRQPSAAMPSLLGTRPLLKLSALGTATAVLLLGTTLRVSAGIEGLLWGSGIHRGSDVPIVSRLRAGKPKFGIYDPQSAFAAADFVAVEHVFLSWLDDSGPALRRAAADAQGRNRWLMVTIEPWADARHAPGRLLDAVRAGHYDAEVDRACGGTVGLATPVFVRWGHEMDAPTGRYPWATTDADAYAQAYRHVVDRCRGHGGQVFWVWSPRGEDGLDRYFPGKSYVDYLGLSIYSFVDAELLTYGRVRSFARNFGEKYDRIRKFDKPLMIAELGVDGSPEHRRAWLAEGLATVGDFPLLRLAVYFNAKDSPEAWGKSLRVPDWTIDPALVAETR